jgi:hypothetical protein
MQEDIEAQLKAYDSETEGDHHQDGPGMKADLEDVIISKLHGEEEETKNIFSEILVRDHSGTLDVVDVGLQESDSLSEIVVLELQRLLLAVDPHLDL